MSSSLSLIHPYTLRDKPKEILSSWNLEFDREPIHLDGRVLPAETIYQPGSQVCVQYAAAEVHWSSLRGLHSVIGMPCFP